MKGRVAFVIRPFLNGDIMVVGRPLRESVDGQDGAAARVINDHNVFLYGDGAESYPLKEIISSFAVLKGSAAGNVVLGSNSFHTPGNDTNTGFEVVKSITNPDKTFLGAGSFYAVYFGTQQPSTGSIQGGAAEAYSLMTGNITKAVLGWEGIGAAAGTGSYQQVIGMASTALAKDTTVVQQLMGYQARGPVGEGTPNVANAYSVKVLEPTVGAERHSLHVIGRTTLSLGTHSKILEILGTSAVKRWDVNGSGVFTGYASNGTSVRTKISADEESTGKIYSDAFNGTTKHAAFMWQGSERLAIMAEGYIRFGDAIRQTTVGPAGTAAALPGPPQGYTVGMLASGTKIVQPFWLAQ